MSGNSTPTYMVSGCLSVVCHSEGSSASFQALKTGPPGKRDAGTCAASLEGLLIYKYLL